MSATHPTAWLGLCRAGFEPDLATEFARAAGSPPSSAHAVAASGFVHLVFTARDHAGVKSRLQRSPMVFGRQSMIAAVEPVALPTNDRVTPITQAAKAFLAQQSIAKICGLWIETPDTNDGKALSKLAQSLEIFVGKHLADAGYMDATATNLPRLHVLLTPERQAWLGLAEPRHASDWRGGIPRLRMPHDAPSRSTLKLAEAIHVFLGENAERLMQPGMRAVDLGAAPGGWTWQLVNRGLHVTAVDNGPLKGDLMDNALVRHLREDGFRYRPKKPVDWMVCDMVEKPVRIAQLVAMWMRERHTERCIFNLKLPMKKRVDEVARCREILREAMDEVGRPYELVIKQLYHDREEVTGICRFVPRTERR